MSVSAGCVWFDVIGKGDLIPPSVRYGNCDWPARFSVRVGKKELFGM